MDIKEARKVFDTTICPQMIALVNGDYKNGMVMGPFSVVIGNVLGDFFNFSCSFDIRVEATTTYITYYSGSYKCGSISFSGSTPR